MLTYHLKPYDQQPLYEQLYHAVRADIMSGALPGGTRLPSKRQLAANLRVSQITVETAYGQLAAEGYIASAPRRGYFVQEQLAVPVSEPQEPFTPPLSPIFASEETYPYDFRTDFVDNGCFPFSTWARLSRSVLSEYSSALLRATDPCGAAELREEIVRYLHDFRGINVSPDNILIGAGSEYLMHLVIQLLGRDRVYALENPGYRKLYQIFAVNGVTVRPTPLDKHGLRADALAASDASVVYLTPSHHFPLGTVMTAARRLEILRWASEAPDRYIIEDDYDSEFRLDGRPLPAMQSLGPQQVIYIGTFSRGIAPAVRIGYLVLPPALLGAFFSRFGFYSCTVGRIEQQTLCRFLETGQYARHQARLRAAYRRKRDAVCAALLEALAPFSPRIENAHTGLHFVLRLACPCTGKALAGAMRRHGVLACPLSAYFHTGRCSEAGPALVLGFGGLAQQDIRPAAQAMARAAEEACAQHG